MLFRSGERVAGLRGEALAVRAERDLLENPPFLPKFSLDSRVKFTFAPQKKLNFDDVLARQVLQQVADGAGFDGAQNVAVGVIGGEESIPVFVPCRSNQQ